MNLKVQLRIALLFLAGLTTGGTAWADASDCTQMQAVYQDSESDYSLRFINPKEGLGAMSNRFEISAAGADAVFDGWVIWNDDVSRPDGTVTFKCPGGDITGKELDKCKVWEGVIYSVFSDGQVDLLPPAADPAADALLLPDFSRVLKNSKAWKQAKLETVPWDLFTFQSCTPAN